MIETSMSLRILHEVAMEQLLEIGVLVGLAVPSLRALGSSAFRRVFPFDALRIGLLTAAYFLTVFAVAVRAPAWLRPLSVPAVAAIAYLSWRSRPAYGVATGLPPGSLRPLAVGPWNDTEFFAKQFSRYGEVFKMSQFGRPMVCVLGLDRANRLLLDHDEQLVAPPLPFNRFIKGGYLRYLPEETHAHYRQIFRALFHSGVLTNAEPRVAAVFRHALEAMTAESARTGKVVVRTAFLRMMFAAWADLFYGIDATHPDFVRLKQLFRVIDARKARWASRRRVESALVEIEAILRNRVESFGDGQPSCLLQQLSRTDPGALVDRTILGNLIYIMQITWGDMTGLLLWVFKMLSDHPEWKERLAREPSRDLATRIVLETLRLEQSESRYRRAVSDLELDGFRIPKGWLVRMCIRESHRDEKVFPHARTFDPDRFLGRAFTRGEYAPFGAFRLACIGDNIAKAVAGTFALELTRGFDWRVVEDGPAQISSWVHNAPHPRLSVALTRRNTRS
jgi:cytochrome P450